MRSLRRVPCTTGADTFGNPTRRAIIPNSAPPAARELVLALSRADSSRLAGTAVEVAHLGDGDDGDGENRHHYSDSRPAHAASLRLVQPRFAHLPRTGGG